jgi:hypothetical protein
MDMVLISPMLGQKSGMKRLFSRKYWTQNR